MRSSRTRDSFSRSSTPHSTSGAASLSTPRSASDSTGRSSRQVRPGAARASCLRAARAFLRLQRSTACMPAAARGRSTVSARGGGQTRLAQRRVSPPRPSAAVGNPLINGYTENTPPTGLAALFASRPEILGGVLTNHQCGTPATFAPFLWGRMEEAVIARWTLNLSQSEEALWDEYARVRQALRRWGCCLPPWLPPQLRACTPFPPSPCRSTSAWSTTARVQPCATSPCLAWRPTSPSRHARPSIPSWTRRRWTGEPAGAGGSPEGGGKFCHCLACHLSVQADRQLDAVERVGRPLPARPDPPPCGLPRVSGCVRRGLCVPCDVQHEAAPPLLFSL